MIYSVFTFLSQIGVWFAIFHKRKVSEGALLSTVVKESNWTCVLIIGMWCFKLYPLSLRVGLTLDDYFLAVPTVVMLAWSFYARPNQFMIFV